jgi:xylan 1,4-beta-xylosidase
VEVELEPQTIGGLLLFQSRNLYLGIGHDGARRIVYRAGQARGGGPGPAGQTEPPPVRRVFFKIQNDRNIVTLFYGDDGTKWTRHDLRMEASAYIRTVGGSESLRPALFAAGQGVVKFRQFRYRAL